MVDGICTDSERFGNGGAFDRGGMAGGGPRLVTEFWDCTRGGNWGSLFLICSVTLLVIDVDGIGRV